MVTINKMAQETILQHWIFSQFILPFLLMWALVFAVLQKTKLLGSGKQQLDSIVAFVVGLIFVGAIFPKVVVGNLILFLTVSIVIVFVGLLLWGFIAGGDLSNPISGKYTKIIFGILLAIVLGGAVLWATGFSGQFMNLLFGQSWSSSFWNNIAFIVVISVALALVLLKRKSSS